MNLARLQGLPVVSGHDLSSPPQWYFLKPENYGELTDEHYTTLYAGWQRAYTAGHKLTCKVFFISLCEEFRNVWAPSGGSTVNYFWVIVR